jgi:hypothetical protein
VDLSSTQLHIAPAVARAQLDQQIAAGEKLLKKIRSATVIDDLALISNELRLWAARNDSALTRVFGALSAQQFYSEVSRTVHARGFGRRRATMARRVEVALGKLRIALAAVEAISTSLTSPPAESGAAEGGADASVTESGKPWWPRVVSNAWTVAIGAPLIVALILAGIKLAGGDPPAKSGSVIIRGSVVCESGRAVVGMWIAASASKADSGLANLGTSASSNRGNRPRSRAVYSFLLRHGGRYAAHVGCGGTASHWASANNSPLLSGVTNNLVCRDPVTASPEGEASPTGSCVASAGRLSGLVER